jgi:DNA-binding transcriptional ArsR family regulator
MTPRKTAGRKPITPGGDAHYRIDRLDQVRLLAHPLRLRLFEAFAVAPRTTHQVAKALGLAPTRLYHHVNALERVGLLTLRETRQVRGATEKYYQAVGRMLEIEPELFAPRRKTAIGVKGGSKTGAASAVVIESIVAPLVGAVRGDLTSALARAGQAPKGHKPVAVHLAIHASAAEIAALRRRVVSWYKECSELGKRTAGRKAGAKARSTRGASRATLTLVFTSEPRPQNEEPDPGKDGA